MALHTAGRSVLFGIRTGSKYNFSTSYACLIKWRYEKDIEPNPNRYGKLTNLPDYSYLDGRPTPLGMRCYRRMKLQESYCKRILELSGEIDFALERYKKNKEDELSRRNEIINSKLKPKGQKLLQKQNS